VKADIEASSGGVRLRFYRGDWPPRGSKILWVAAILEYEGRVALMRANGDGWLWPATSVQGREIPAEAVARLATRLSGSEPLWARPVGLVAIGGPEAGEEPVPSVLVFSGRLRSAPVPRLGAIAENADLTPYEHAASVVRFPLGKPPVEMAPAIVGALVAGARADAEAGPGPEVVTEVRQHVMTRPSYFHCRMLRRTEDEVWLEYTSAREGAIKGIRVPAGSRTVARYRLRSDHVPWRITGPDGSEVCSLIHLADRLRIAPDRVSYRDLLLDVLVLPGRPPEVIDQDDLARAEAEGLLTESKVRAIQAAAERLAANPGEALDGFAL